MAPKISLAMIVKDEEENLGPCLDSIASQVDEIIIVDTGSTDRTREVAVRYGASVFQFDARNHPEAFFLDNEETGKLIGAPPPYSNEVALCNFGAARSESFDRATGDYILWVDADDVVEGGRHLREIVADLDTKNGGLGFLAYDYARDHLGRVFYRQWRERIIKRGTARWVNAVHEVLLPSQPLMPVRYEQMFMSHRRKADRKSIPNRNYKILLHDLKSQHTVNPQAQIDPRHLFYLGQEARFIEPVKAVGFYEEYLKLSGWPEERSAAHSALGQLSEMGMVGIPEAEAYQRANRDYAVAAAEMPDNPDGLFGLARIAYLRGRFGDCINYSDRAFAIGNTDSMLGANPMDRLYRPHAYYNHALSKVGRLEDAIASCKAALAVCPDDPGVPGGASGMITFNLRAFEEELRSRQAAAVGKEKPIATFDKNEDVDAPPSPGIPQDALVIWAIQLWKQLVASGEADKARALVGALPARIAGDPAVQRLRDATNRRFPVPSTAVTLDPKRAEAIERRRRLNGGQAEGMSIVFWLGPCFEHWDPTSPNTRGLGGSETAAIEMAKNLAALGHRVTVLAEAEGIWDGVSYIRHDQWKGGACDVFIASRAPWMADGFDHGIDAKLKLLWVHDIHVGPNDANMQKWLPRFDSILCLSNWHREFFLQNYPFLKPDAVMVTRNGIDPERFHNPVVRDSYGELSAKHQKKNDLVFSSSPNRGLDTLLQLFPLVRQRVPDVHLHVAYGFDCWETMAKGRGDQAELAEIQRYKDLINSAVKNGGVTWHGRMNQKQLAEHFMQAKVHAYPASNPPFPETSCISAMEAMAAGCIPVTTRFAALAETVKYGILLDLSPDYGKQWVDAVVEMLTDETARAPLAASASKWALENLSWSSLARDWEGMFKAMLSNPMRRSA